MFPNGKELAESMSAFSAVRLHLQSAAAAAEAGRTGVSFDARNVVLVAVGDGVTPRTAALFAFRTQCRCVSIDPLMRRGAWDATRNLTSVRARAQNVRVRLRGDERAVVVMWHAHVGVANGVRVVEVVRDGDAQAGIEDDDDGDGGGGATWTDVTGDGDVLVRDDARLPELGKKVRRGRGAGAARARLLGRELRACGGGELRVLQLRRCATTAAGRVGARRGV